MKLSSRKQLLKESDNEMIKLRKLAGLNEATEKNKKIVYNKKEYNYFIKLISLYNDSLDEMTNSVSGLKKELIRLQKEVELHGNTAGVPIDYLKKVHKVYSEVHPMFIEAQENWDMIRGFLVGNPLPIPSMQTKPFLRKHRGYDMTRGDW